MAIKRQDIDYFYRVHSQLESIYSEIGLLSKKSPNETLNKFKLKYINSILKDANILLNGKYKPFEDFDSFEEDNLPTNSDVVLILGQYLGSLEEWRSENVIEDFGDWYWLINGKKSDIQTYRPKQLRR